MTSSLTFFERSLESFFGSHIDFILGAILLQSVGGTENERMSRLVTKSGAFKLLAKLYGNAPSMDLVHNKGLKFPHPFIEYGIVTKLDWFY